VYGLYTSMVYMATLPGGWIADRLIGPRRAVLYGGVLIACGHFSMAVPAVAGFYLGLVLIVIGTGLLKGNISVLVGRLYTAGDPRRDAGFSLYYMGINLGAFLAPLACGYLGQRIDWHLGFGAAGVGMTLGLIQYVAGARHLGDAGMRPAPQSPQDPAAAWRQARLWGGLVAGGLLASGILLLSSTLSVTPAQVADAAGYLLLIITVAFFAWLFFAADWTPEERQRLYAIAVFFLAAALFWSEFEQAGSTLNLFADRSTRNSMLGWEFPSSWFQSVNALFIIGFAPVIAWVWVHPGWREPSSPVKFAIGLFGVGLGFAILVPAAGASASGALVSPLWLLATYLMHTLAELCLSPVGLSSMTRLAPARVAGLMMGVWFLAASVGNFIGGRLAAMYESYPLPQLFGVIAATGIVCGLVLLMFSRKLERLTGAA
jgi:POT family proton-dependent oligopeptide transporter